MQHLWPDMQADSIFSLDTSGSTVVLATVAARCADSACSSRGAQPATMAYAAMGLAGWLGASAWLVAASPFTR